MNDVSENDTAQTVRPLSNASVNPSANPPNQISNTLRQSIDTASKVISQANSVCILTGAGISAESGIPTFRDKQTGLWKNYRAEDLANIDAFRRNPQFVWSWYQWRRNLVKDKKPNPAHHVLAQWQKSWQKHKDAQQASHDDTDKDKGVSNNKQLTIITQNVDDLHEQAGSKVTHLHGHLWKNRCFDCGTEYTQTLGETEDSTKHSIKDYTNSELLRCPECGGYIRPDIVWFGEMLPQKEWQIAESAAMRCEVFISIGTSSVVYPAAGLSSLASQHGATIIEINPNPTANTLVDIVLAERAGVVLPELVTATVL